MKHKQEVELKLSVEPADVERLRALPLLGRPRASQEQITSYFDTDTGDLRKAGFSLRVRRKGRRFIQTLKEKGRATGGFSARGEWERPIKGPQIDFAALEGTPVHVLLARKKVRSRLTVVSETRVRRTTWLIREDGSLVELILDEGEIAVGDRREPISELELELKRGNRQVLFDVAREIGRIVPLRLGVMSKSERGALLGSKRPRRTWKAERIDIEPGTTVADAFAAIVQSCLRHFRRNEAAAAVDRHADAVHQLRVAMRRLRSAFSLFRPVVEGPEFETLREELRGLSTQLGAARDLDVTRAELSRRNRAKAASAERRRLEEARSVAYDALAATLASEALPGLFLDLAAWAEAGDWRNHARAARSIEGLAEERLGRLWRRVRKGTRDLASLDAEARHELRIEVKKLRYASEFFVGLTSGGAGRRRWKAFVDALAQLQEELGALNDVETARSVLGAKVRFADQESLLRDAVKGSAALREIGPYWR